MLATVLRVLHEHGLGRFENFIGICISVNVNVGIDFWRSLAITTSVIFFVCHIIPAVFTTDGQHVVLHLEVDLRRQGVDVFAVEHAAIGDGERLRGAESDLPTNADTLLRL